MSFGLYKRTLSEAALPEEILEEVYFLLAEPTIYKKKRARILSGIEAAVEDPSAIDWLRLSRMPLKYVMDEFFALGEPHL